MSSAVTSDAASSYLAGQAWGVFIELKGGLMLAQGRRAKHTQFWQGRGLGDCIPELYSLASREIVTIDERNKCGELNVRSATSSLVRWVALLQVSLLPGLFCR